MICSSAEHKTALAHEQKKTSLEFPGRSLVYAHKLHKNIRGFQQNWLTVFYVMNDGLGINDLLKYLYVKMHGKSIKIK